MNFKKDSFVLKEATHAIMLFALIVTGWVNTLVGGQKEGARGFMFFIINVDLTEEGLCKY